MSDTPTEAEETPLPILYDHCCRLYKLMLQQARMEVVDEEQVVLWEGALTRLIKDDLNYSVPYYTHLTGALKRMGCIRQLRRGGSTSPSLWQLLREPTEEAFKHAEELRKPGKRPQDVTDQRLKDMNDRLLVVEKALGII
jgi:hypothetical protein